MLWRCEVVGNSGADEEGRSGLGGEDIQVDCAGKPGEGFGTLWKVSFGDVIGLGFMDASTVAAARGDDCRCWMDPIVGVEV